MANLFKNSFFSIEGQKERLSNVVQVLSQSLNPFSKAKPVANVENKVAKAALEFAAANPYTTAGLIAAPAAAGSRGAIIRAVSSLSTKNKVIAGAAALVAGPTIATNQDVQTTIIKTASKLTPESLLHLGGDISKTSKDPTGANAKDLIQDNKVLLGVAGGALALTVGAKALPAILNFENTRAIKENTEKVIENTLGSSPSDKKYEPTLDLISQKKSTPTYAADVVEVPATPVSAAPQTLAKTETLKSTPTKKRKSTRRAHNTLTSINQRVSLIINNKNSMSKRYLNQRMFS